MTKQWQMLIQSMVLQCSRVYTCSYLYSSATLLERSESKYRWQVWLDLADLSDNTYCY